MTRKNISSNSEFEDEIAYSRAVVDGDYVFISGTTGYDYKSMTISEDVVEQTEQCFKNIEQALLEAGSSFKDVVRVTYILPKKSNFQRCWPVLKKYFDSVKPAATMIEAGLINDDVKIEVEITARSNS